MSETGTKPSAARRIAAIAAIALTAIVVIATLARGLVDPQRVLGDLVLLFVLLAGTWIALTRTSTRRVVAVVVAAAALIALVVSVLNADGLVVSMLARIAGLLAALGLARYALGTTTRSLKEADVAGAPVPAATRGVLFMNLKSGGGKAERFHLVDECKRRGIEPIVLQPGEDWLQRVRDVAASGVDVLGMAGGDGSQAMVGTVAAEFGLPMVVVPAGTRNHLALVLGLDRDDVVGALDAYGDAVERTLDLADVNGHVFVNNVSLGLYAAIVRSPEYRDAKVDTTLATLPQVLGPDTEPFDLRFTGPDGQEHRGAHVIQISNNPYGTTAGGAGSRPRLDTGQLGVISLVIGEEGGAAAFLAAFATGHPDRFGGFSTWSTPTFEVTSGGPIELGLDGETQEMDSPLRFSMRPDPVRVRLPHHAIGYSPAALSIGWRQAFRELWGVVLGRPSRFQA
jgi:diacylglycerol kinase family enzyme